MKKLLLLFCFFCILFMNAQSYEVLSVTSGYNQDVIANGVGNATASTTIGLDNANYDLMAADFDPPGTGMATAAALPVDGVINSPGLSGLSYQLADYTGNNSLRLATTNQSGTLTFSNQISASNVFLLVNSGSGTATISVQVQFTDGTNQDATGLVIPDWFYSIALPVEKQGIGRVLRTTNAIETNVNEPRLYRLTVAILPANQTKLISSLLITKTTGTGIGNIFAASAQLIDTCPPPYGTSLTSVSSGSATLGWNVPAVAPVGYDYYYSTSAAPPTSTTIPEGSTSTTSATINGLSALTTYYFWVRSDCGSGDVSSWFGPFAFTTAAPNDDCSSPITVPVNATEQCSQVTHVTFLGATVSPEASSCTTSNNGDLWYQFTALGTVHEIEMINPLGQSAAGTASLEGNFDDVIFTLYDGTCGSLTELYCTSLNNILATDLEPGHVYLLRVTDNTATSYNSQFDICINTPDLPANQDSFACSIRTINSDFETPQVTGIYPPVVDQDLVQGWRTTASDGRIEFWPSPNYWTTPVINAYSGNQFIELNANVAGGVYQDYDTPAATTFTYGFAHRGRSGTDVCQLKVGPPGGPYTIIGTFTTGNSAWSYYTGTITTPDAQPVTRFIFEAVSTSTGNNSVGNFLDAVSFVANNGIVTTNPLAIDCDDIDVSITAAGGGTWSVAADNPGTTVIADPNSNNTTVSGFTVPGTYHFQWNGTYCTSVLEVVFDSYVVEFNYDVMDTCANSNNLIPTLASGFTTGGTFSSDSGLVINPVTGEIDVEASAGGTHTITYSLPDTIVTNCDTEYSVDVTIIDDVVATQAPDLEGCDDISNDGFLQFDLTSQNAIVINGQSNVSVTYHLSAADAHNDVNPISSPYTNTTPYVQTIYVRAENSVSGCYDVSTFDLIVHDTPILLFENYYEVCSNGVTPTILTGQNVDFELTDPGVSIVWTQDGVVIPGATSNELSVLDAGIYAVEVSTADCTNYYEITVHEASGCIIPQGISPGTGDTTNERFDLNGFDIAHIAIFNRMGTEVYTKSNYTDEWYGQTDKGEELPVGTYFYVLTQGNGNKITGWVYVNRKN